MGVLRLSRESLQGLLTKALARDWTPAQSAILARTEVVESVVEAVARVREGTQVCLYKTRGYICPASLADEIICPTV